MGCPNCPEIKSTTSLPRRIHPILDQTELGLQSAWISEILPEQKQLVTQLIQAIQALKNPYTVPLEAQLQNLMEVTSTVTSQISCRYCRKHTYYDLVESVAVALEFERGHIWHAVRLEIVKDVKKWGWLLLAALYRKVIPWLRRQARN